MKTFFDISKKFLVFTMMLALFLSGCANLNVSRETDTAETDTDISDGIAPMPDSDEISVDGGDENADKKDEIQVLEEVLYLAVRPQNSLFENGTFETAFMYALDIKTIIDELGIDFTEVNWSCDRKYAGEMFKKAFDEMVEEEKLHDCDNDLISDEMIYIYYSVEKFDLFQAKLLDVLNEEIYSATKGTPFEGRIIIREKVGQFEEENAQICFIQTQKGLNELPHNCFYTEVAKKVNEAY